MKVSFIVFRDLCNESEFYSSKGFMILTQKKWLSIYLSIYLINMILTQRNGLSINNL